MRQNEAPGMPSTRTRVDGAEVHAWYGVRYAQAQRFAAAQPAAGRLDATHISEVPIFPQLPSRLAAVMGSGSTNPQAEDAFYLNIWAPVNAEGLPVVVFIHGGAWMTGGGAMAWYDGSRLAARGLVVVNVSYRVGPLGHLGQPEANPLPIPADDLLLSLDWVVRNVRSVGGDPGRITLAGQSAGGWYAHLLSVLPQTEGLVRRVALLSMGTRQPWHPEQQRMVTARAGQLAHGDLQCTAVDVVLNAGITALDKEAPQLGYAPSAFLPVAGTGLPDKLLNPAWAAKACHADAIYIRYTADEAGTFFFNSPHQRGATQSQVDAALSAWASEDLPTILLRDSRFSGADSGLSPYRQLVAAASWRQFQRFPSEYAAALQVEKKDVRLVRFATESELDGMHSGHCFDLPFQFGNMEAWNDAPMLRGFDADHFQVVSHAMLAEMAEFAGA